MPLPDEPSDLTVSYDNEHANDYVRHPRRSRRLLDVRQPKERNPVDKEKWPPPGFPVVEGEYILTDTWSIRLTERFARRVEDGCLILWRPGLTLRMVAWNNDHGETQAKRLSWIKESASPGRYAEQEFTTHDMIHYSYRLCDESKNGPVETLSAYFLSQDGHLQMAVYFDDPRDEDTARQLVESVSKRQSI